jgi:hypothetical protein
LGIPLGGFNVDFTFREEFQSIFQFGDRELFKRQLTGIEQLELIIVHVGLTSFPLKYPVSDLTGTPIADRCNPPHACASPQQGVKVNNSSGNCIKKPIMTATQIKRLQVGSKGLETI